MRTSETKVIEMRAGTIVCDECGDLAILRCRFCHCDICAKCSFFVGEEKAAMLGFDGEWNFPDNVGFIHACSLCMIIISGRITTIEKDHKKFLLAKKILEDNRSGFVLACRETRAVQSHYKSVVSPKNKTQSQDMARSRSIFKRFFKFFRRRDERT